MKVSVIIPTYNHEKYIAETLQSVLKQEVNFDYEIVLGEDFSTDNTRAIVIDFTNKYPDKFNLILQEKNVGPGINGKDCLNAASGKYIALLDGDDYWTSPHKLQQQVDLLEEHPECSGCFHNVLMSHEGAPDKDRFFHESPLGKHFFDLKDIVSSHFIPTCSTVFRARLYVELPDWYVEMPMGDWLLHILNAEHGTYVYIDEVLATYRVHGDGVWSGKSRLAILDRTIHACHRINRYLYGRHPREISRSIRALTHEFEIEASEILKAQAEFGGAFMRLVRAFLVFPKLNRRITRCFRRLLTAWCGHYCAIGKRAS